MNILMAIPLIFNVSNFSQPVDTNKAWIIIERQMKIIENYVYGKDIDSTVRRAGSISFLEQLSGIQSEDPGSYNGKMFPTIKDYKKWYSWYQSNKEFISWDEKSKMVDFHKKIRPPSYE